MGAYYTILAWVETIRTATRLRSDEYLAETLWTALEGVTVGSLDRLKSELARVEGAARLPGESVKGAARRLGVVPKTIRNRENKQGGTPMPKVPPTLVYDGDTVEPALDEETKTA